MFIPILLISVIFIIIFLVVYFNKKNSILRKLSKFKPTRITQFRANELTKVTGKVLQVEEPFIAPYSKRKCVAYVFEIQQNIKSSKGSHWRTLVKKEDIQHFFIKQNEELVIIKPSKETNNYTIYMVEDKKVFSGTFKDPTTKFKNILDRYGIESENWFGFNKTLRYSERILEIGETITVGGIAKWKVLKEKPEGHNYSKVAALESNTEQKIIITDHPNAIKPLGKRL